MVGLGTKNHSLAGNELDPSDEDGGINFDTWPVHGMYQPDAIAAFEANGATYVVTANEGDSRDEDTRVKNLSLDPAAFPMSATLQLDENLGRLEVSDIDGDTDGDGDYDMLYAYGARSFSIWDATGTQVFDSGDDFGQLVAQLAPAHFDDGRSDNKGSEPEGVTVGQIDGLTYAFVGLERFGGVMVYDITDPMAPVFETYVNTTEADRDISPEGLEFIAAADSPNGHPLLVVSYEVSGDVAVMPQVSLTKSVETAGTVMGGDVVTYSITLANTGMLTVTDVTVEDRLPDAVEFGHLLVTEPVILPPPALVWELVLGPSEAHTIRFMAVVTTNEFFEGTTVTNTATFSSTNAGVGMDHAIFGIGMVGVDLYLPLMLQEFGQ